MWTCVSRPKRPTTTTTGSVTAHAQEDPVQTWGLAAATCPDWDCSWFWRHKGQRQLVPGSTTESIVGDVYHLWKTAVSSGAYRGRNCSRGFREEQTVVSLLWGRGLDADIFLCSDPLKRYESQRTKAIREQKPKTPVSQTLDRGQDNSSQAGLPEK